jgi:hypothetical protein
MAAEPESLQTCAPYKTGIEELLSSVEVVTISKQCIEDGKVLPKIQDKVQIANFKSGELYAFNCKEKLRHLAGKLDDGHWYNNKVKKWLVDEAGNARWKMELGRWKLETYSSTNPPNLLISRLNSVFIPNEPEKEYCKMVSFHVDTGVMLVHYYYNTKDVGANKRVAEEKQKLFRRLQITPTTAQQQSKQRGPMKRKRKNTTKTTTPKAQQQSKQRGQVKRKRNNTMKEGKIQDEDENNLRVAVETEQVHFFCIQKIVKNFTILIMYIL